MSKLKAFQIFLSLAALIFVAKPFLGFGAFNQQSKPRISHTVLVKSFTKRKPESLEDANTNIESIHRLLIDPLAVLISSISVLLLALFPKIFNLAAKITDKVICDIRFALLPPEPAYLLSGQLII
jgi:hypothetical protein